MATRAEKRRQIVEHLRDPMTASNPNATIARFFGVTASFVAKLREEVEADGTAFQKGTYHNLPVSALRLDGGTQPRAQLNKHVSREYRDDLKAGAVFPPIGVVYDGEYYWVWDGFHRADAFAMADRETIQAEVRQGTRRDAVLLAAGANNGHGLRRTNEDKRRAVEHLLRDPEWATWSDNEIARKCGVTHPFVGAIRKEVAPETCNGYKSGADGRTIDVSAIGRQPSANRHTSPPADVETDDDPNESESQPQADSPTSHPMVPPVVVDHRVSITLNGDDEKDAARLINSEYPRERLRKLAARIIEHFEDDDDGECRPIKLAESHIRLLNRLRQGPAMLGELEAIGGNRYAARFWELRRAGYDIAKVGGNAYELLSEPA